MSARPKTQDKRNAVIREFSLFKLNHSGSTMSLYFEKNIQGASNDDIESIFNAMVKYKERYIKHLSYLDDKIEQHLIRSFAGISSLDIETIDHAFVKENYGFRMMINIAHQHVTGKLYPPSGWKIYADNATNKKRAKVFFEVWVLMNHRSLQSTIINRVMDRSRTDQEQTLQLLRYNPYFTEEQLDEAIEMGNLSVVGGML